LVQRLPASPLLQVLAARPSRGKRSPQAARTMQESQSVFLGERNNMTDNAVWLGKKSRLSGPILRVAKVAQADANQAKPLVRSEALQLRIVHRRCRAIKTHRLIVEECSCERCRK
jgi:hypothetical protein